MARKIFVSYKHEDSDVQPLGFKFSSTARDYVDVLIEKFEGDEIYKGEGNEDLSEFKDETIKSHLRDKIFDSSITIVLISPGMDDGKPQHEQFIPWEISYSLQEPTRDGRTSKSNGILAVVLPDRRGLYEYYITRHGCPGNHAKMLRTEYLFQILKDNMFNKKNLFEAPCRVCGSMFYAGYPSYVESVKWCDFMSATDYYLKMTDDIRGAIASYNIAKMMVG